MRLAFGFAQAADPPGPPIIVPMPRQRVMHLIDQSQRQRHVPVFPGCPRQVQKVAYREGIRP
jgi:hypothetical protein